MALSKKQFIFANYLLTKLGFSNSELVSSYLNKLESIYGKYYSELRTETFKNGSVRYFRYTRYNNSDCIEELLKEIDIKKDLNNIKLQDFDFESKISATDLAMFEFCPASFSISKSFHIEFPTNEDKRLTGIKLHETLRLIDKKNPENLKESDLCDYTIIENEKLNKIKNCELVFVGHSNKKKLFKNEKKNFIGQPDYIFKDPNGKYFVVEEKFKFLNNYISQDDYEYEQILESREKTKKTFFSNHIVQLQSYIDYIQEYNIDYGILIYWFYDFKNNSPNIHNVTLKILHKNEYSSLLENVYANLNEFIIEKNFNFHGKVNPNKCAACAVNKYCVHKTNNFQTLKLPYIKSDLQLKDVEFPEELKKENNK